MGLETEVGNDEAVTGLEPEPAAVEAVEQADTEASTEVMSLLAEGVPLALLADLANPDGPASPAILEDEGLPEVAWWDEEHGAPEHEAAPQDADGGEAQA
ncbi:hypothetical protein ICW40_10515 [Actinotalea ferrariae]|uniref:hypothetical protein n=1 Tax=Actinotalea ferrariae TaxID=1386098 RepID=UPI001C8BA7DD|nr:hypothetical protein [Actinotalea ferrariae]MBX9245239.1 hypothetical protein [Actinotalea ferrariae]